MDNSLCKEIVSFFNLKEGKLYRIVNRNSAYRYKKLNGKVYLEFHEWDDYNKEIEIFNPFWNIQDQEFIETDI